MADRVRIYGIVGCPIGHTLSPVMYNRLFSELGLNALYVRIEVPPGQLEAAVEMIRARRMSGFHLTCPHKERILKYLDETSGRAANVQAANVVLNRQGVLSGHNTDGVGFLASVTRETSFSPAGATVGVVGAGGAARAIAGSLAESGAGKVVFFNRTLPRAVWAAKVLHHRFEDTCFQAMPLSKQAFSSVAPQLDLLVNAARDTGDTLARTFTFDQVPPECVISDINYYTSRSPFLGEAQARGFAALHGIGMLVHQGALSLKFLMGLAIEPQRLRSLLEL